MHACISEKLPRHVYTNKYKCQENIDFTHKQTTLCLRLEMLFKKMHYLGFARVLLSVRRDRARGRVSLSHTNVTCRTSLVYPECIATLKTGNGK